MGTELIIEPQVDLRAMARIVHDLVGNGAARLPDEEAFRSKLDAAGLSAAACTALMELRWNLELKGGLLLQAAANAPW